MTRKEVEDDDKVAEKVQSSSTLSSCNLKTSYLILWLRCDKHLWGLMNKFQVCITHAVSFNITDSRSLSLNDGEIRSVRCKRVEIWLCRFARKCCALFSSHSSRWRWKTRWCVGNSPACKSRLIILPGVGVGGKVTSQSHKWHEKKSLHSIKKS